MLQRVLVTINFYEASPISRKAFLLRPLTRGLPEVLPEKGGDAEARHAVMGSGLPAEVPRHGTFKAQFQNSTTPDIGFGVEVRL